MGFLLSFESGKLVRLDARTKDDAIRESVAHCSESGEWADLLDFNTGKKIGYLRQEESGFKFSTNV